MTLAAPTPLLASPGNAPARGATSHLDEDDGSRAGGSSGIAYRSNGNSNGVTGFDSPAPKYAIASAVNVIPPPIMEKSPRPERPLVRRPPRARSPWAITFLTLSASLLGAVLLGLILKSLVTRQLDLDPKGCRMSYMRPSYAHLSEFDTEHTRFASKYSLYLYREQGVDDETKVRSPGISGL